MLICTLFVTKLKYPIHVRYNKEFTSVRGVFWGVGVGSLPKVTRRGKVHYGDRVLGAVRVSALTGDTVLIRKRPELPVTSG